MVLSLFCWLFVVLVVGLRFRPAYGTFVVACPLRLPPAVSGSGVRCGCACWGLGSGCAPPLLGGVLGCVCARTPVPRGLLHLLVRVAVRGCVFVRAPRLFPAFPGRGAVFGRACWAQVSAVPRPSWLGCRGVFFALFFWACLGLALWCRLLAVPVLGLVVPVPPSPFFRAGLLALFFFSVVCVCMFRCPFSRLAAVPGLVLPVLAGWSPCASLGVLCSVPSGWAVWTPLRVLVGGLKAVGCSLAPPSSPPWVFFFTVGSLPVPPSAFPRLAHALARIQCGLPGCCWWLHCAWPCSGHMGRVGYVHAGLGAPSCLVRSWLCRLGGCARRLRVALD